MNEVKLIKLLKDSNVRISTKGNICLNDFVVKVVGSGQMEHYRN